MEDLKRIVRTAAHIIHCSLVQKPLSMVKMWPLKDDNVDRFIPPTSEEWAAMKARQKAIDKTINEQIKLN